MHFSIDKLAGRSNLTHAQQMIWIGQQLLPDVPLYNMALSISIDGPFTPECFREAFESIVQRSDAMRSTIQLEEEIPQRHVLSNTPGCVELLDFSKHDAPACALSNWMSARCIQPFALSECLFDCALIRLGKERHVWYLNQHHLITDGWSAANLVREVSHAYHRAARGVADQQDRLPQFETYAEWEKTNRLTANHQKTVEHWKRRSKQSTQLISFYGNQPTSTGSRSERMPYKLDSLRSARLRKMGQEQSLRSLTPHLTNFNFFSTILFATLYRLTEQQHMAIGTPSSNRSTKAFKDTIGLFVELFPLQVEFDDGETFLSLLEKVKRESHSFLFHAQPASGHPALYRSFNVVLNYIAANLNFVDHSTTVNWLHAGHGDPGHHLRLVIHDFDSTGEFTLLFDVNRDVFNDDTKNYIVDHFLRTLDEFLDDPAQAIQAIDLVSAPSDRSAVEAASDQSGLTTGSIIESFQAQVQLRPTALAVTSNGKSLTYQELSDQSDQIARLLLREYGVGNGEVIAVFAERSTELIVAILGVLKAGGAYLPVDPSYPAARISLLVEDASVLLILTPNEIDDKLAFIDVPVLSVKAALANSPTQPCSNEVQISPAGLAYVIYTSGSTGSPNGVLVEHRNVISLIDSLNSRIYQRYEEALNVALVAPLVFDASVQQIFASLLLGHTLHIVPEDARMDGTRLRQLFHDRSIDVTDGTPAHLQMLAEAACPTQLSLPSHFILGGDRMSAKQLTCFYRSVGPQTPTITNIYGVAECCVDSCAFDVTAETAADFADSIPIGEPLPNSEILILNPANQQQPVGVAGEIAIAGKGVSRGYLNRDSLNKERFIEHPARPGQRLYLTGDIGHYDSNGTLHFHGRRDNQIKVRGIRIELGEIEHHLRSFQTSANDGLRLVDLSQEDSTVVRCSQCLLTSKHPDVDFDGEGVCNVCQEWSTFRQAANAYFRNIDGFTALIGKSRQERPNSDFDCLLLYSGGKDSSYVLHRLVELGLKVLAFTFDNGFISKAAFDNISRQTTLLGVESVIESASRMDEVFVESLMSDDTVCTGCFRALTAISTRIAHQRGINVVVTGLSRGQIFDTKLAGLFRQGIHAPNDVEESLQVFRQIFHANDDRTARLLDVDLQSIPIKQMHFVDFFRYDNTSVSQVRNYLQSRDDYWNQPKDTGFCSSNCVMNDVGICVHSSKRGYHNYEAPLSWDIRLGISTRDEVLPEVSQPIDPNGPKSILTRLGFFEKRIQDVRVLDNVDEQRRRSLSAYFSANHRIEASELREYLANRIPSYMIPSRFIQLERMPLTAHGKIDDQALRSAALERSIDAEYQSPRNDVEQTIAEIWKEVLRVDRVGVTDNFFDLGGDSIGAIQIVAFARRAGLQMEATQLLEAQTVEKLAKLSKSQHSPTVSEIVAGPIALTPIQRRHLGENDEAPMVSQALIARVPVEVEAAQLTTALEQLIRHHDALQISYEKQEGVWQAVNLGEDSKPSSILVETVACDETRNETIDRVIVALNSELSVAEGKLISAALVSSDRETKELLVVAHYLAMDAASWPILLEDWFTIYKQLQSGEMPQLPNKTTTFRDWSQALAEYAESDSLEDELRYWNRALQTAAAQIPSDELSDERNFQEYATDAICKLDADSTKLLLESLPKKNRRVHEVLLTALAHTLAGWVQRDTVQIDVESHGRDAFARNLDVSRTVGRFTSIYPLTLTLPGQSAQRDDSESMSELLTVVADQVRGVPRNGFNYGLLRYLRSEADLQHHGDSAILFNYLGRVESLLPEQSPLENCRGLQHWRSPQTERRHQLEINVMVDANQLVVRWTYNQLRYRSSTIQDLAESFNASLVQLINHANELRAAPISAADFPQANLDSNKLKKLSALLGEVDSKRRAN